MQQLLKNSGCSLEELVRHEPVLDVGAADGALSFFLERLGYRVHAVDYAGCNMNRMQGMRTLARHLGSQIEIHDLDLDARFELAGHYGCAFFLGALYHLKNPFYALDKLSARARFCFVSTRVARLSADRQTQIGGLSCAPAGRFGARRTPATLARTRSARNTTNAYSSCSKASASPEGVPIGFPRTGRSIRCPS